MVRKMYAPHRIVPDAARGGSLADATNLPKVASHETGTHRDVRLARPRNFGVHNTWPTSAHRPQQGFASVCMGHAIFALMYSIIHPTAAPVLAWATLTWGAT